MINYIIVSWFEDYYRLDLLFVLGVFLFEIFSFLLVLLSRSDSRYDDLSMSIESFLSSFISRLDLSVFLWLMGLGFFW